MSAGSHTYKAYSSDVYGNVGYSNPNSFTVDAQAPTTVADGGGYNFGDTSAGTVNVGFNCIDTGGSGCAATFYCVDNTDNCTPTTAYGSTPIPVSENGTSYVRYYSADVAGNNGTVASQTIVINTSASLTNWSHRKKITISHTNVGSALTDFPLLVKITADSDLSSALATGYDIRFTKTDGTTLLKYERESWSGGGGSAATGVFWVKVPTISKTVDTDIYMYYGNAGATDGQDAVNTWNSDFKAVYHLADPTNPTDSTGAHNGTDNGATAATGKINGGAGFNGSSQWIQTGAPLSGSTYTYSMWFNPSASTSDTRLFCSNYNGSATFCLDLFNSTYSGSYDVGVFDGNAWQPLIPSGNVSLNNWYYLTVVDNAGAMTGYINGVQKLSTTVNYSFANDQGIGTKFQNYGAWYNGLADESRASNVVRSADWIKFEYCNQTTDTSHCDTGSHPYEISFASPEDFNTNTAPTIGTGPSDGGSSTTTPTSVGNNVTFTATATDGQSNNYYLAICKTDAITANNNAAPTCATSQTWCVSGSTVTGVGATCNSATTTSSARSNIWYAFVCDHNAASACSASAQGSSDNGSPFVVNVYYWVGGTGNWSDATNHWSTTSGGSGNVANVPGTGDVVIFNSSSGGGTATINANISVKGINMVTGYTGTITQSGSYTVTVGTSGITEAAGTYTGNAAAITNSGDFSLSGGTFTSTSGIFSVAGNWSRTAGTFTHHSGTVKFTSTATGKTITTGAQQFQNLTFDGVGGGWTLQDALSMAGNFTLTNGTFNQGANAISKITTYTQAAGGTYNGGAGTVTISGNLTIAAGGTFNSNGETFYSNSAAVETALWNAPGITFGSVSISRIRSFTLASGTTINLGNNPIVYTQNEVFVNNGTIIVSGAWTVDRFTNGAAGVVTGALTSMTIKSGDLTIPAGSTFPSNVALTFSNPVWAVTGTLDAPGVTFGIVTINKTRLFTVASGTTINLGNNPITYTQGAGFLNNGIINVSGAWTADMFANGVAGVVNGALTSMTINVSDLTIPAGSTFPSNVALTFTNPSTAAATVLTAPGFIFGTVTINKNRSFTLASGTTINLGNNPTTVTSTNLLTNNGTIVVSGGTWTASQSVTNAGTITHNGTAWNITGNLMNNAASTITLGSSNLTVSGSFTNSGTIQLTGDQSTFTEPTTWSAGSIVEYTATSSTRDIKNWTYTNATLKFTGSGGTFVVNASKTVAGFALGAGAHGQITSGQTLTVAGNFTSTATTDSHATLSAVTGGSRANMPVSGTATVNYIEGTDIDSTGGTLVDNTTGGATSNCVNWHTFNTTPNIPTLVSPASGSATSNNKPTLSANYSDADTGDTGTTNYRISTSSLVDCTNNTNVVAWGTSTETASNNATTTWTPSSTIGSDATYYWCAQNNDGVATSSWTQMGTFILDTANPTVTITSPTNGTYYTNTSVSFAASQSDTNVGFLVPNLDSSLVSWWRMEDNAANTTVTDYMGAHNGTTARNTSLLSNVGHTGSAMSFNGTSDYVSVPDNPSFVFGNGGTDLPFSVSYWVKKDVDGDMSVVCKEYNTFSGEWQLILGNDGKLTAGLYGSGRWQNRIARTAPNGAVTTGSWHLLTMTYNGSKSSSGIKIYIDGTQSDNANDNYGSYGGITDGSGPVRIGYNPGNGSGAYYKSNIDEVMIFNRALTADEITALYNGTAISHSSTLSEGSHTYKVYSSDLAGNIGTSGPNTFTVDATAPNAATSLAWSQTSPYNSTSITASWAKSNSSDLANQKIQFYTGSACNTVSGSLIDLSSNTLQTRAFTGADATTYTYKITSIDNATNQTVSACSAPITIDTTAPTVSTVTVQTGLTVDVAFSEAMGTGVTTASNYTISGTGKGTLASNPASVANTSGNTYRLTWNSGEMLNAGTITITVATAQDTAGNTVGTPNSGNGTGIGVAPSGYTVAIDQSYINNANKGAVSFTFTSAEVGATYNYSFAGTSGTPVTGSGTISTGSQQITGINLTGLGEGTVTLTAYLTDPAGNQGSNVTSSKTKDTVVPTTGDNFTHNDSWQATSQTITLTPTDASPSSGFAYTKYCLTNGCDPSSGTAYTIPVVIATEGTSYFRYASADSAGNTQTTVSRTVKVDTTKPITTANGNGYTFGAWTNANVTVTLSCSDTNGSGCSTTFYCIDQTPSTHCTPNISYSTTPPAVFSTNGTWYIRYSSTDLVVPANVEDTVSKTINIDKNGPSVNAGIDQTKKAQFTQDATVTAGSSPISTYAWTKFSGTGTITFGTPTAEDTTVSSDTDGTFVIRLTVTDQANNSVYDDFTLVWDTTNPVTNAGVDQTKKAQFTQTGSATDTNGSGIASYLWSKVSGPGAITFGSSTQAETTISADTDGTYVIRLTSTDNATNSSSDDFTLVWDTTAPTTTDNSDTSWHGANQTITLSPDDGTGSGVAHTYYCIDTDDSCTPTTEGISAIVTCASDTNCQQYVRYYSTDNLANDESVKTSNLVKIDKKSPITTADAGTYIFGDETTSSVTVTLSCLDAGGSGCSATFYCADTDNTCTPTTAYETTPVSISTEGTSYIRYASTDLMSNAETTKSQTIKIVTTPAPTPEPPPPSGGGGGGGGQIPDIYNLPLPPAEGSLGVAINNGAGSTATKDVVLTFFAGSNVTKLAVSNSPDFTSISQETYSLTKLWTLSDGQGTKTVYAKFFTKYGVSSAVVSASINYNISSTEPSGVAKEVEKVANQVAIISKQIAGLFGNGNTPTVDFPPIGEVVTPETPEALAHKFDIVKVKDFGELDISFLPSKLKELVHKFPEIASTLEKVGITKAKDVTKLNGVAFSFPGLSDTAGVATVGVKAKDFTSAEIVKIPSNFIFARTTDGKIDINMKVALVSSGDVVQSLNILQNKTITLTVKTDTPAQSVEGVIILLPDSTPVSGKNPSGISASLSGAVENSANANKEMVLQKFTYKDENNDGVFTADITAPGREGKYRIDTTINYIDKKIPDKQISIIAVVDPEGYVYANVSGMQARVKDAMVSLYWLNTVTNKYELWPAKDFQQINPQRTDQTGKYSYLVPAGYYYLSVDVEGYSSYQGKPFQVSQGAEVNMNVQVSRKGWLASISGFEVILITAIVLLVLVLVTMAFLLIRKNN